MSATVTAARPEGASTVPAAPVSLGPGGFKGFVVGVPLVP